MLRITVQKKFKSKALFIVYDERFSIFFMKWQNLSNFIAKFVFLLDKMQISKAEANLFSLNFLQKRTGRVFPVIKYGNKAHGLHIFTHHIYKN